VARELTKMGIPQVKVLKGGWKAWLAAGYPTEAK
jgi:3-mercaptopyruvate sulfurtransferase SseA